MLLSIISAMNHQNIIGLNNQLPWHLPADLQRFKHITMGNAILMGRKTFESIGKPLPGRQNIIITRQQNYQTTACDVADSLQSALQLVRNQKEVFIIGGADLYSQAIALVQKMYLSIIHHDFCGDRFFPDWNRNEWHIDAQEDFLPDEKNKYAYSFLTLSRR